LECGSEAAALPLNRMAGKRQQGGSCALPLTRISIFIDIRLWLLHYSVMIPRDRVLKARCSTAQGGAAPPKVATEPWDWDIPKIEP